MKALVYKSTGSWYSVKLSDISKMSDNFTLLNARIKGLFKIDEITSTNPVAVGDEVEIEMDNEDGNTAMITAIFPRRNYINRQSPHKKHQQHIVAANIDQSVLVATMKDPRTSQGFIDRFLVACEMYHVPATIVFNKADLFRKKDEEKFMGMKEMYEAVGYRVIRMSVMEKQGIEELKELLKNKTSL